MGRKRKRQADNYSTAEVVPYTDTYVYSEPTVEGAYCFQYKGDMPWDIQRYWIQRFDIFSLYNQGIWTTENSWFEVTPEAIANKISEHVASAIPTNRSIIVDAFCGIGGNAIAFARSGRFKRVYAIEKDEAALACAKHNAEVYGVSNSITWFQGDCFEILGANDDGDVKNQNTVSALREVVRQFGVIFASPPWGGPGYKSAEVFDLDQMQPYSLDYMHKCFSRVTKNMVLYLPRTSDLRQIAHYVEGGHQSQIIHYCTSGGSRALCTYFGDWGQIEVPQASDEEE